MPSYRYIATDISGQSVEGSLQSASIRSASDSLRQKGLKVARIIEDNGLVSPAISPVAVSKPVAKQSAARQPTVRTTAGTNKDLFFLFSQLESYLKSGIAPAQALSDLQSRVGNTHYKRSLVALQAEVSAGGPMSDGMERYPDLYPPHVVGLIRAGEAGGFLPEACAYISRQARDSMRWARPFSAVIAMAITGLIAAPLAFLVILSALDTWSAVDAAGGKASGGTILIEKIIRLAVWPVGPAILAGAGIVLLIRMGWRSLRLRPVRHGLAATWPIFRKRTAAEGAAMFAWTLSNLSKAGIAPYSAWTLAMYAVPNLSYRARLEEALASMHERTPLSEALKKCAILPAQATMVIQTGEMTGSVPEALLNASEMSQSEYEETEGENRRLVVAWRTVIYLAGTAFFVWLIYAYFYPEFMRRFLQE